jgi:hypothetical protein
MIVALYVHTISDLNFYAYFFTHQLFRINGFFNLIIFLAQKIYTMRRVDHDLSVLQCLRKLFFSRSEDPLVISQIPNIESVLSHSIAAPEFGTNEEEVASNFEDDLPAHERTSKVPENDSEFIGNSVISRSMWSGNDIMSNDDLEGTSADVQDEQQQMGSIFSLSSSISRHSSRFSDVFTLASKGISSTGMSYKTEE